MQSVVVAWLLWTPWMWFSILLHESAHFFSGRALGLAPDALVVGRGPLLYSGQAGRALIRLHLFPSHGAVLSGLGGSESPAWKHAVFYAAGLTSDTILLCVLLLISLRAPGLDYGTRRMLFVLAGMHAAGMLLNLVPRNVKLGSAVITNDGKKVWQALRHGRVESGGELKQAYVASVRRYDPGFRLEDALAFDADPALRTLSIESMVAQIGGNDRLALEKLRAYFAAAPMSRGEKAMWLDDMASKILFRNLREQLPQALQWAGEARALLPDCTTLKGTYGACLIECAAQEWNSADTAQRDLARERVREGSALLRPLTTEGNEAVDIAYSARALAKACDLLGDAKEAAGWRKHPGAAPEASPWGDTRKVRPVIRFAAGIFPLCIGLGIFFTLREIVLHGWAAIHFSFDFNVVVMLPLVAYGTILFGNVAIRGRAPSGWVPWR